ncbi:MAG: alpha/beta hydrolase, partial [Myxococcales bacterium]|nr:alpha/beta hydrolase [Myxococcales bacterium]
MLLWTIIACNHAPPAVPTPAPVATDAERIELTTRDGVALVADAWRGEAGAPAVLLLHMTPTGGWNRTDWPTSFVDGLRAEGWWVVALDRRGAGESGGEARDAFEGEGGRYDVESAVTFLTSEGAGDLAILGASNGSTSALDYALWAGSEGLREPVALGFLTGGTYTENQNTLEGLSVPVVFT